jgi:hypothetical protein
MGQWLKRAEGSSGAIGAPATGGRHVGKTVRSIVPIASEGGPIRDDAAVRRGGAHRRYLTSYKNAALSGTGGARREPNSGSDEQAAVMPTIETQVVIEAPASKVWGILTDFAALPAWNPFIRNISGSLTPGSRLTVQIEPPGQSAMTFTPTVLVTSPDAELRWLGTVMARWVFAGEHYFVLEPMGPRTTRFTHGERFSGLLGPLLMRGPMLAATKQGFSAMNDALKHRAE